MEGWKTDDLALIGDTDEIEVAAHASGQLTKPVPIWVVRVNDNLYVRSYRGHAGAWFRAAQASGQGRIWAGDEARDVAFVAASIRSLMTRLTRRMARNTVTHPMRG